MFTLNLSRKDFFNKKERLYITIVWSLYSLAIFLAASLYLSVFEGCVGVYNRGVNRARIYAQLLISAQLRLRRLTHSVLLWRCEAYSLALCSVSILFVSLCYETVYVNRKET